MIVAQEADSAVESASGHSVLQALLCYQVVLPTCFQVGLAANGEEGNTDRHNSHLKLFLVVNAILYHIDLYLSSV